MTLTFASLLLDEPIDCRAKIAYAVDGAVSVRWVSARFTSSGQLVNVHRLAEITPRGPVVLFDRLSAEALSLVLGDAISATTLTQAHCVDVFA